MTYQLPPDVDQLVKSYVNAGIYHSEADVLRDALRALADEDQDLKAVRQAISELHAGDEGLPVDEAFEIMMRKYGITDGQ